VSAAETPVKPSILPLKPGLIPEELCSIDAWVGWRLEWVPPSNGKPGRWTKEPIDLRSGGHAKSDDPSTWATFEYAIANYLRRGCDGIGLCRTGDLIFIDWDGVLDETGNLKPFPWAQKTLAAVARRAYLEQSVSRTGLHGICRAAVPLPEGRRQYEERGLEHTGVAFYDKNRFFTFTGAVHPESGEISTIDLTPLHSELFPPASTNGTRAKHKAPPSVGVFPSTLTSDDEVLQAALRATNGDKVRRILLMGDVSGYKSPSEADHAAVGLLAFWTEDPAQIKRIIAGSALHRDKHERLDYLDLSITKILAEQTEHYDPYRALRHSFVFSQEQPKESAPETPPDLLPQHFYDAGNADRLIAFKGKDLRYCHATNKWLVWDGRRWEVDESERARASAVETTLEFLRQAIAAKNEPATEFAKRSLNSGRITNMLREAQPHLALPPDQQDQHPYLLNFLNGTVDLRTGELHPHRHHDCLTKLVHYNYNPDAECSLFLATLTQLMGGEKNPKRAENLVNYLQRAIGYSLTGVTDAKAVFIAYGGGDNGKTTLLSLIATLFEEYSAILDINTLMTRVESNNTQSDLADLRGARFVRTSETEEGQRLAEGKLKRITQGMGKIKACRKYENPIEFQETHKLWMDANHKPQIRGTDNAIWNRLHLIPFDVTIPKDKIDRALPQKLLAEAEGILAWAVCGAQLWFEEGRGLTKPPEVESAGDDYRAEQDEVRQFIDECCVVELSLKAGAKALFNDYRRWPEGTGERPLSGTAFGTRLRKMGFSKSHTAGGAIYSGIGVRSRLEAE
jgi:putative DNA primase/helicase